MKTRAFYPGDLAEALQSTELERARAYLEGGCTPDDVDTRGNTALMWAVKCQDLAMVKTLVEAGATVNKENAGGSTALMWAAAGRSVDIVDYLLEQGARIDVRNNKGETALIWAADRLSGGSGNIEVIDLLLRRGAPCQESLLWLEDADARARAGEAVSVFHPADSAVILKEAWRAAHLRRRQTITEQQARMRRKPVPLKPLPPQKGPSAQ